MSHPTPIRNTPRTHLTDLAQDRTLDATELNETRGSGWFGRAGKAVDATLEAAADVVEVVVEAASDTVEAAADTVGTVVDGVSGALGCFDRDVPGV